MSIEAENSEGPNDSRNRNATRSLWRGVMSVFVIVCTSLLASMLAVVCSSGFSFAWKAVEKAGDDPPKEVSFELQALLTQQAYLNAALTGIVLAFLLASGFLGLRALWNRSSSFLQVLTHTGAAVVLGGTCLALSCLAFRLQSVGAQNLSITSAIHALLWGGLGGVVVNSGAKRQAGSGWKMPRAVLAGLLWGACYPILIVILFPGVYVEQLFSTDTAVAIWGGVGCGLLLTGSLLDFPRAESTQVEAK
ncbi:hypothetical protein [Rubinisphaera brasiliensis]|uniref:Uncharacterized protein n=1 Tax=Rubinisphaera brasiliensis (strain ATCC 49424 / DSM 5305 / JCM 21570 / IAM 15109 / NBRC 103401 / IFAM 1448) TaxID=756272 RepID=F0SHF3_RUBBR|nr:hypothetical protein [Rubinisphaera brasiliensis]ADY61708.1 hypothetical protein Plabr_4133 [Rubinisphaera brasiliensis DSM 5305]